MATESSWVNEMKIHQLKANLKGGRLMSLQFAQNHLPVLVLPTLWHNDVKRSDFQSHLPGHLKYCEGKHWELAHAATARALLPELVPPTCQGSSANSPNSSQLESPQNQIDRERSFYLPVLSQLVQILFHQPSIARRTVIQYPFFPPLPSLLQNCNSSHCNASYISQVGYPCAVHGGT